jgi:arginase family enzyme
MKLTTLLDSSDRHFDDSYFVAKHVHFFGQPNVDPEKQGYQVALLGVPDEVDNRIFEVADQIRNQMYQLAPLSNNLSMIDLGNIKPGNSFTDACVAISEVFQVMTRSGIILILIGGTSKFNYGGILTYQKNHIPLNMVSIDSRFSRESIQECFSSGNQSGIKDSGYQMANYINIGYQSYFVPQSVLDFVDDSYFEAYRLGFVRNNVKEMEPVLRDANHLTFSLNAIKHSDAPGALNSSPNGLSGDEACQLSFFTGHSNRITSLGIYDMSVRADIHQTTLQLAAQVVWYFLEGVANRIFEEPDLKPQNFTKYLIHNNDSNQDLAFYQSNLTNRWWMELFFHQQNHHLILSCSENDYELACKQEIPDRWWKAYQRIQN